MTSAVSCDFRSHTSRNTFYTLELYLCLKNNVIKRHSTYISRFTSFIKPKYSIAGINIFGMSLELWIIF